MSISRTNTPSSYGPTLPDVFEELAPQAPSGHEEIEQTPPPPSAWEKAVEAADRLDLLPLRNALQEAFKDFDSLPNFEDWEKEANSLLIQPSLSDLQKAIFDSLFAFGILKAGAQFEYRSTLDSRSDLLTWIQEKIPSDSSYVGPETLSIAALSTAFSKDPLSLLFGKCSQQTKEKILPEAFFISIKLAGKSSKSSLKWQWIKKLVSLAKEHSIEIEKNLLLSSLLLTTKPRSDPYIEREILHYLLSLMDFPSLFHLFKDYFSPSYLNFSRTFRAAFERGSMLASSDDIRHSLFLGSLTDSHDPNLSNYRISHFINLLKCFHDLEADADKALQEKYLSIEAFSSFLETGKNSQWKNEVEEIFQSPDFISIKENLENRELLQRHNQLALRINDLKSDPKKKSAFLISIIKSVNNKLREITQETARGKRKNPSHEDDPQIVMISSFPRKKGKTDLLKYKAPEEIDACLTLSSIASKKTSVSAVSSAAFPFIQVETVKDGNCLPHAIALEFLRRGSIPSAIKEPVKTTLLNQLQARDVEGLKKSIRDLGASAIEGPESDNSLMLLISAILEDWEQEFLHFSQPLLGSDWKKAAETSLKFSSISLELRQKMLREQYNCNAYTTSERTQIWQAYVDHAKTDKAFLDTPFIKGLNTLGIPVEVLSKSAIGQKVVMHMAIPQPGYDKIFVYRPSDEHHYYGLKS